MRPRVSSRLPIDADARPLPSDETTPPVTKMNLVCFTVYRARSWCLLSAPQVPIEEIQPGLGPFAVPSLLDAEKNVVFNSGRYSSRRERGSQWSAEVILVIEDDAHIGGLVAQVLREAGFAPALVRDVRAAREWGSAGEHAGGRAQRSDGRGIVGTGPVAGGAGRDLRRRAARADDRRAAATARGARRRRTSESSKNRSSSKR